VGRSYDGTTNAYVTLTPGQFTAMPFGTIVAVLYQTTINSIGRSPVVVGGDAGDAAELFIYNNGIGYWNGAASVDTFGSTPQASANVWQLIALTKATGTTAVRMHLYSWPTHSWAHNDAAGTISNSAGTGLTEHGVGGFSEASGNGDLIGTLAAAMVLNSRVLSDQEIERLPRGNWYQWAPDLLVEYPSGRDNPSSVRELSRNRMRQTASAGTSRSALRDPPGFRFSPQHRRR
jgi:hypothetical protein